MNRKLLGVALAALLAAGAAPASADPTGGSVVVVPLDGPAIVRTTDGNDWHLRRGQPLALPSSNATSAYTVIHDFPDRATGSLEVIVGRRKLVLSGVRSGDLIAVGSVDAGTGDVIILRRARLPGEVVLPE